MKNQFRFLYFGIILLKIQNYFSKKILICKQKLANMLEVHIL